MEIWDHFVLRLRCWNVVDCYFWARGLKVDFCRFIMLNSVTPYPGCENILSSCRHCPQGI